MTDPHARAVAADHEVIAFRIGAQAFALGLGHVREIRGWTPEMPLPHAVPFVRGVTNLRGTVLPILDLARRLGLGATEPSPRHVVIVVQRGEGLLGLLVDAVVDIQPAPPGEVRAAPGLGSPGTARLVTGVLACGEEMVLVLSLADVLAGGVAAEAA